MKSKSIQKEIEIKPLEKWQEDLMCLEDTIDELISEEELFHKVKEVVRKKVCLIVIQERQKTLEEVSKAFHETFYRSGELWFDYLFEDGDKEAEENARGVVDEYWEEILSKITKRG